MCQAEADMPLFGTEANGKTEEETEDWRRSQ
jgi:hypothetical protein